MTKRSITRRTFLQQGALLAATPVVGMFAGAMGVGPGWAVMGAGGTVAAKPVVGIQVGPESFVDEGVGALLDWLQERAGVNLISLTTFTYGQGFAGRMNAGRLYPGHGDLATAAGRKPFHGGNFATPHARFYGNTVLKDTRAPDHGTRDILEEVLPEAKKRGMKIYCGVEDRWDRAFDVPGLRECAEVDLMGRSTFDPARSVTTCVFNPNVREFWKGIVSDLSYSYPIDGILFENERSGPLTNVMGISPFRAGVGDTSHVACFCEHHRRAAQARGIDFERAKQGYEALHRFVQAAVQDQRPPDGYYVTYQEILQKYPGIVAYDRMCDEEKLNVVSAIKAAMGSARRELKLIFHIEQTICFNPAARVTLNYERLADMADFLKPATYNNCAGERYADLVRNIAATIYRDMPVEDVYHMLNHQLNYEGLAELDKLATAGLPADYVRRETERALAGVKGRCGILAGIDVNVPVAETSRKATPEDTYAATLAALQAGAQGIVLSRKYAEMRKENLEGAGKAIQYFLNNRSI